MKKSAFSPAGRVTALLLAALPLAAAAQNSRQDSLLRAGNLVGGRPHASVLRPARPSATPVIPTTTATGRTTPAHAANADPVLARRLHENVDIGRVPASELPGLYARLLALTRRQGRQWSPRDWAEMNTAIARLNARYEDVRLELPMTERLNVRSDQGEFRTLQAAHQL